MQRQRLPERDYSQPSNEKPEGSELEQVRAEFADIFEHVDQVMDSIGHLDAQEYLEQNRQTGGQ